MIDIIIILIIIICTLIGAYIGLIRMSGKIAALILAIIIASSIAPSIVDTVYKDSIKPSIESTINEKLSSSGIEQTLNDINAMITDASETAATKYFDSSIIGIAVTNTDKNAIDSKGLNMWSSSEKITKTVTDALEIPVKAVLTPLWFGIVFLIANFVLNIAVFFIAKLLTRIKIIDKLQRIGGAVIGFISSAIVCFIAADVISYLQPETINGTIIQNITNMF